MISLKEYILNQSRKLTRKFVIIFFVIFSFGWMTLIFNIYVTSSNNIVNSLKYDISNSILLGDFFAIQNVISSLIESKTFDQIIIKSNSQFIKNDEIDISNIGVEVIENKKSIKLNELILFFENKLYYSNKINIYSKKSVLIGFFYFAKKINIINIITAYLFILLILFVIIYVAKREIKLIYNRISSPILEIEKYIMQDNLLKGNILEFEEFDNLYRKIISYQEEIQKSQKDKLKIAELSAITSTIQMLAHDLRQPFSRLKMSLEVMKKSKSYEEILYFIQKVGANTSRDIMRIEYFLNDIIQSHNSNDLILKEESLLKTLSSVLKICFEIQNSVDISLEYHFSHEHKIFVDLQKFERVLSNIIMNAIQSIENKKGKLWIKTNEYTKNYISYIDICIGNNNSYIEQDDLNKIFNLFFTKGKKKGTGLGLAIASQIIKNHGGTISCKSCRNKGVQFFISLPIKSDKIECNLNDFVFPDHSNYYNAQFDNYYNKLHNHYENQAIVLENKIFNEIQSKEKKLYSILILEDDQNYIDGLLAIINGFEKLKNFFNIFTVNQYDEGFILFQKINPDFLICDIDLNDTDRNGFDFVKQIRVINNTVKICIHTNRFIKEDFLYSMEIKSDFFIVKPMLNIHLLNFMSSLFFIINSDKYLSNIKLNSNSNDFFIEKKHNSVIVVDDDELFLELWKYYMTDANLKVFNHPSLACDFLKMFPEYLEKTECIILDFYIESNLSIIETDFIESIRKIGFRGPIFLCSNAIINNNVASHFDGVLEKQPCNLSKIKKLFKDKF